VQLQIADQIPQDLLTQLDLHQVDNNLLNQQILLGNQLSLMQVVNSKEVSKHQVMIRKITTLSTTQQTLKMVLVISWVVLVVNQTISKYMLQQKMMKMKMMIFNNRRI
jgi:hypothetical protein